MQPVISRRAVVAAGTAALAGLAFPRRALAREKLDVAIGAEHSIIYLPWDVAKAHGYLEREGFDANLIYLKSGAEAANALISGNVDYAAAGVDHAVVAQTQGKTLELIVQFMEVPAAAVLIRPADRAKIPNFAALKGKTVGITSLGAGSHVIGLWLAKQSGLSRDDVRFLPIGSGPTAAAALDGLRVDAAVAYDPLVTNLIEGGKAVALLDLYQPDVARAAMGMNAYAFSGTLTRDDVIAKKADQAQRVVNALVRALKFMNKHTAAEVADSLGDDARAGLSKPAWARTYEHARRSFTSYGHVSVDGVRSVVVSNLYAAQKEATKVDVGRLFDLRFAEAANRTVKV